MISDHNSYDKNGYQLRVVLTDIFGNRMAFNNNCLFNKSKVESSENDEDNLNQVAMKKEAGSKRGHYLHNRLSGESNLHEEIANNDLSFDNVNNRKEKEESKKNANHDLSSANINDSKEKRQSICFDLKGTSSYEMYLKTKAQITPGLKKGKALINEIVDSSSPIQNLYLSKTNDDLVLLNESHTKFKYDESDSKSTDDDCLKKSNRERPYYRSLKNKNEKLNMNASDKTRGKDFINNIDEYFASESLSDINESNNFQSKYETKIKKSLRSESTKRNGGNEKHSITSHEINGNLNSSMSDDNSNIEEIKVQNNIENKTKNWDKVRIRKDASSINKSLKKQEIRIENDIDEMELNKNLRKQDMKDENKNLNNSKSDDVDTCVDKLLNKNEYKLKKSARLIARHKRESNINCIASEEDRNHVNEDKGVIRENVSKDENNETVQDLKCSIDNSGSVFSTSDKEYEIEESRFDIQTKNKRKTKNFPNLRNSKNSLQHLKSSQNYEENRTSNLTRDKEIIETFNEDETKSKDTKKVLKLINHKRNLLPSEFNQDSDKTIAGVTFHNSTVDDDNKIIESGFINKGAKRKESKTTKSSNSRKKLKQSDSDIDFNESATSVNGNDLIKNDNELVESRISKTKRGRAKKVSKVATRKKKSKPTTSSNNFDDHANDDNLTKNVDIIIVPLSNSKTQNEGSSNKSNVLQPSSNQDLDKNLSNGSNEDTEIEDTPDKLPRKSKDRARNVLKRIISESKISNKIIEESYALQELPNEKSQKQKHDPDKNSASKSNNSLPVEKPDLNKSDVSVTKIEVSSSNRKSFSLMDMFKRYSEKSPLSDVESDNLCSTKQKNLTSTPIADKSPQKDRKNTVMDSTPTVIYVGENLENLDSKHMNSTSKQPDYSKCLKASSVISKKSVKTLPPSQIKLEEESDTKAMLTITKSDNKLCKSSLSKSPLAIPIPCTSQTYSTRQKSKRENNKSEDIIVIKLEDIIPKTSKITSENIVEKKPKKRKITIRDLICSETDGNYESNCPATNADGPANSDNQTSNTKAISVKKEVISLSTKVVTSSKGSKTRHSKTIKDKKIISPKIKQDKTERKHFTRSSLIQPKFGADQDIDSNKKIKDYDKKKLKKSSKYNVQNAELNNSSNTDRSSRKDLSNDNKVNSSFNSSCSSNLQNVHTYGSIPMPQVRPKNKKEIDGLFNSGVTSLNQQNANTFRTISMSQDPLNDIKADDSFNSTENSSNQQNVNYGGIPASQMPNLQVLNPFANTFVFDPATQQLQPTIIPALNPLIVQSQNQLLQYPTNCLVPYNPITAVNSLMNYNLLQNRAMMYSTQLNTSPSVASFSASKMPDINSKGQNSEVLSFDTFIDTTHSEIVQRQRPEPRSFKVIQKIVDKVRKTCSYDTHAHSLKFFSENSSLSHLSVKQFYSNPLLLSAVLPKLFDEESHEIGDPSEIGYIFDVSFFDCPIREVVKDYVDFHLKALYESPIFKDELLEKAFNSFRFRDSLYLSESFPKENELLTHKDLISYLSCAALLAILDECKKRKLV